MIVAVLGLAAGGGSLVGCHRNAAVQAAQAGPNPDSVKQSFAVLEKQFSDLQQSFSNLSKDVETIPANLSGYPQLRAHFYAVEEVRGVTDAKVTVLSGRLESALRSGKRDELQQVSNDIDRASKDCRKIGALYIKLLHEVMAFQRAAEQQKPPLAASNEAPSPAKTKRSKSKP
jgi:hypothetical protein